ncbi:MAG: hypothetical protein AAFX62_09870 [Pseudomonadota bacterium]
MSEDFESQKKACAETRKKTDNEVEKQKKTCCDAAERAGKDITRFEDHMTTGEGLQKRYEENHAKVNTLCDEMIKLEAYILNAEKNKPGEKKVEEMKARYSALHGEINQVIETQQHIVKQYDTPERQKAVKDAGAYASL